MIHWVWLIIAIIVSVCFGFAWGSILAASTIYDLNVEIERLKRH